MANILDNILSMLNFGGVIKNTLTKAGEVEGGVLYLL